MSMTSSFLLPETSSSHFSQMATSSSTSLTTARSGRHYSRPIPTCHPLGASSLSRAFEPSTTQSYPVTYGNSLTLNTATALTRLGHHAVRGAGDGWTLAEQAGELSPDGMQRLLRRADWDVDGVRDDVRDYVTGQLGEPDGVLIADETGFLRRARSRPGCSGSIRGRRGGRRTARSGCSWPMRQPAGMR